MGYANLFYHMIFIIIYVIYIKSYKFYKNQITITLAFELIIVALLPYLLLSKPLNIIFTAHYDSCSRYIVSVDMSFLICIPCKLCASE